VPAAEYLSPEAKIAFPIRAKTKQFVKVAMLKVCHPGYGRKRKTPAIELRALEQHVNPVLAKGVSCATITAGQERLAQTLVLSCVVKLGNTHYLRARYSGKGLDISRHSVRPYK
jgi:hypothetical protein